MSRNENQWNNSADYRRGWSEPGRMGKATRALARKIVADAAEPASEHDYWSGRIDREGA